MIKKILTLFLLVFLIGCSNIAVVNVPADKVILQSNEGSSAGASWGSTYTVTYKDEEIVSIEIDERFDSPVSTGRQGECHVLLTRDKTKASDDCGGAREFVFEDYAGKIMTPKQIEEKRKEDMKSVVLSDGRKCDFYNGAEWYDSSGAFCYKDGVLVTFIGTGFHGFIDYWRVQGYTWTEELGNKTSIGNWPKYNN